jgi:hypothetical protein
VTCRTFGDGVVICTATVQRHRRSVRWCRKCHADRWHELRAYEWYKPDRKCLTCGRFEHYWGRRVGYKPLERWEQRL